MRQFTTADGEEWLADAREEETPRHHGRWYLTFRPQSGAGDVLPMPEVRWKTHATAERTLATMSLFELRRRLDSVRARTTAT
jgi:hypothetical protein